VLIVVGARLFLVGVEMQVRAGRVEDAAEVVRIYNAGIEEREATFETRPREVGEILGWFDSAHPIVVVEEGERIVGFAAAAAYRPRDCYAGVAEFSVYVDGGSRGRGVGWAAMEALIYACEEGGFWKLVSRVFVENAASRALLRSVGFREVGTYERHARLDGVWKDVVIVERLLGEALNSAP
jgi:L-amino acid N-acyltransferase YncA